MRAGDLIDDRFELETLAGFGGTSAVYRARDLTSSQGVAIKFLNAETWPMVQRFVREARILSDLHHPGIVRYIAHGIADSGVPYLAMEWLEGESLSHALGRRNRLDTNEALRLMRRVADALSLAHARGIIHRDLKPSNLFLVENNVERVKVLDFGLARGCKSLQQVTTTGHVVGTPGYMAPEQARGAERVGAQVDIFSLGCVLYECLTGQPAFAGQHMTAILAKVLVEQAPSARKARPELPPELDALLSRMLAKDPEQRPADAQVLMAQLAALMGSSAAQLASDVSGVAQRKDEPGAVSVLLIGETSIGPAASVVPPSELHLREVGAVAAQHGGKLEVLGDGSMLIVFTPGTARDAAYGAARCALALRKVLPTAPMALASTPNGTSRRKSIGAVIDRAAGLLESFSPVGFGASSSLAPEAATHVRLDRATAELLDSHFEIALGQAGNLRLVRAKA